MRVFNERAELGFTPEKEQALPWMERVPVWAALIYLLFLGLFTTVLVYQTISFRRHTLTRSAIKESFDHLPTGLGFSEPEGFVVLANLKMEQLSFALTGQDFQNANAFWEQISKHPENIKGQPVIYESQPCFRLENQEIWSFRQDFIQVGKKQLIQLSAVNISELYQLSEKVKKDNQQLLKLNQRLKQYSENMDSFVKSRELLETKVNIHKEMGQALLASRAYLLENSSSGQTSFSEQEYLHHVEEQKILKRWESVVLLLRKEAEPVIEQQNGWKQFMAAAHDAGVEIVVTGELPSDETQQEYLLMAAVEALTNAVRHGQATQLSIAITENDAHQLSASFSNNGKLPEKTIREGGGLGSLRVRLEEAGGTMEIKTTPEFHLLVTIPTYLRRRIP